MARRIRWQILIAVVSAALVLGLMSYLALTTAAIAQPLAGGVFTEYEASQPTQVNPLLSNPATDTTAADLQALLYDGLMRIGTNGFAEPDLLESWPEIDESGTVYTFTLRMDVRWHDGAPLSADDALFTLRSVQSPGFVGDPTTARIWRNVLLERIDDQRFRATLPVPLASFLSYATFPILPAHLLSDVPAESWSTTDYNTRLIGTGPYMLAEPISSERALLKVNPNYFRGKPYIDSIDLRFNQSAQDALTALSRNQAVGFGVSSTNEQSRANAPRSATRHTIPLASFTTLTFNMRQAPFDDVKLRQALSLGLDKDAIIKVSLNDLGQRLESPILPGWALASHSLDLPVFDAQSSADALDAAGYAPGADGVRTRQGKALSFTILTDTTADHTAAAREVARQWAALGVQVKIEQVEPSELEQRLQSHSFDVALHGWQRQGPDPDALYALWHSSGAESGFNYAGLQDSQIDEQLTLGREQAQPEARRTAYAAFEKRWLELAPGITLYQPLFVYTSISDLGGLAFDTENSNTPVMPLLLGREDRFRNVVGWFLQSGREIGGDLRQRP